MGHLEKGLPKEEGRITEENEAEGRTNLQEAKGQKAGTDESASDRGGQFPGSQENVGQRHTLRGIVQPEIVKTNHRKGSSEYAET